MTDPVAVTAFVVAGMATHMLLFVLLERARQKRKTVGLFGFKLISVNDPDGAKQDHRGHPREHAANVFAGPDFRMPGLALENLRRWIKHVYAPFGAILYGAIKLMEALT